MFYWDAKHSYIRDGFKDGRAGRFCNHCFFCDHFEELQTALIKVKLIINNAPLTYVYPNTIKTYLTPKQLLCYSDSYDVQL